MKKICCLILFSLISLNAQEDIDNANLNINYLKQSIEEDFQNCIKSNNYMDCEEDRILNKSKAEIFEMNYNASEKIIKDRKIKEELLKKEYKPSKEEKEIDEAYDKCYKKASTIDEQKECIKKILINKNTKD